MTPEIIKLHSNQLVLCVNAIITVQYVLKGCSFFICFSCRINEFGERGNTMKKYQLHVSILFLYALNIVVFLHFIIILLPSIQQHKKSIDFVYVS